jgi:hypothetical protein
MGSPPNVPAQVIDTVNTNDINFHNTSCLTFCEANYINFPDANHIGDWNWKCHPHLMVSPLAVMKLVLTTQIIGEMIMRTLRNGQCVCFFLAHTSSSRNRRTFYMLWSGSDHFAHKCVLEFKFLLHYKIGAVCLFLLTPSLCLPIYPSPFYLTTLLLLSFSLSPWLELV